LSGTSPLVVPPLGSGACDAFGLGWGACDALGLGWGACDALGLAVGADTVGAAETTAADPETEGPALPQAVTTSPMDGMRNSRPSRLPVFE
jgi:hypothetical protein